MLPIVRTRKYNGLVRTEAWKEIFRGPFSSIGSYDRPPAAPRQMWTPGIYMDIHRLHRGPYNNLVAVCLATEVSFIVISVVPKTRSEKGTPSRGVSLQAYAKYPRERERKRGRDQFRGAILRLGYRGWKIDTIPIFKSRLYVSRVSTFVPI